MSFISTFKFKDTQLIPKNSFENEKEVWITTFVMTFSVHPNWKRSICKLQALISLYLSLYRSLEMIINFVGSAHANGKSAQRFQVFGFYLILIKFQPRTRYQINENVNGNFRIIQLISETHEYAHTYEILRRPKWHIDINIEKIDRWTRKWKTEIQKKTRWKFIQLTFKW